MVDVHTYADTLMAVAASLCLQFKKHQTVTGKSLWNHTISCGSIRAQGWCHRYHLSHWFQYLVVTGTHKISLAINSRGSTVTFDALWHTCGHKPYNYHPQQNWDWKENFWIQTWQLFQPWTQRKGCQTGNWDIPVLVGAPSHAISCYSQSEKHQRKQIHPLCFSLRECIKSIKVFPATWAASRSTKMIWIYQIISM